MNNKVNLTEEMNRMRNLFGYKAGKVISEQEITSSNTLNEQSGYGSFGQTYGGGADQDARVKEKLQGIADKKKEALANNNMVTDNGVQMRWTDYIVKNGIQPSEIKAAEQLNATANTDLKKQQDRYRNIVKTIDSVDDNGIIQISTPSLKGKSWVDYANQYKISQDEINKAREYVKTAPEVKTDSVVDNVPNAREQNLLAMYKLVDKDGIIRAPGSSQQNNKKWSDYVTEFKVTPEELSKLSLKDRATRKKEPWVGVLETHVNKDNVRNGFFELDWNEQFVLKLKQEGYGYDGDKDEEIVDRWFRELCANVVTDGDYGGPINTGVIDINEVKRKNP